LKHFFKHTFLIFILIFIQSCGGSSDSAPAKKTQAPLSFLLAEVNIYIGDNAAENTTNGGSGTGSLSFTSSNKNVVTVNPSTGSLSIIAAGKAIITATKASDDTFLSRSASYTINILKNAQNPLVFEKTTIETFMTYTVKENSITGGSGSGAINFTSNNPEIATVDATLGIINIIAAGSTTIIANKAEDNRFLSATAQYTINVSKLAQSELIFNQEERTAIVDGPIDIISISGGSGAGELSYSSSNILAAEVDPKSGDITLLSAGKTVITAEKGADKTFDSAVASYNLTAIEIIKDLTINLSPSDAEITWKSQEGIIEVYRSTEVDCEIANYNSCENSNLTLVNSATEASITDTVTNITQPSYFTFLNQNYRSTAINVEAKVATFPRRKGQQMVKFAGKMWVFGGLDDSAGTNQEISLWYNDVWSSKDGITWKKETSSAAFSARAYHQVIEYKGSLYLFGGSEGIGTQGAEAFKNDVWRSVDGILWELVSQSAPFQAGNIRTIVFKDKLFIIGGNSGAGTSSIWSSSNGTDWDIEVGAAPFGPREGHALFIKNEKLFLFGGFNLNGLLNDIWSSTDGINWQQEKDTINILPRTEMSIVNFNDALYMIGGHSFPDTHNTVYTSTDGITWTLAATDIILKMNQYNSLTEFNSRLWLYSGLGEGYLWNSKDALTWKTSVAAKLLWSKRSN
jgi:uncharacterized protein YjdB